MPAPTGGRLKSMLPGHNTDISRVAKCCRFLFPPYIHAADEGSGHVRGINKP